MRLFIYTFLTLLTLTSCTSPTTESIAQIIRQDNIVKFERLTKELDIDTLQFGEGATALHFAIMVNANNISKKLINDDFQLNTTDSLNHTPLLLACQHLNIEIIDLLLKKSVNININDDLNGISPLHYAIYNDNLDLVKRLLHKNADINIKSTSVMAYTPLHYAIEKENIDIVSFLMENKAIDTIQDVNGNTAVDLALQSNSTAIKMLFYPKMNKEYKDKLFLHTARYSNDTLVLKKLFKDDKISKNLINEAFIFSKSPSISQMLLDKGAKIAYKHKNHDIAAIHYAAIRGDTIMLDFLLKHGANVNQLSKKNQITPLMHAARLYEDHNIKSKDIGGFQINLNPLFQDMLGSSEEKNPENSLEAVKFLIKKKANIHFKNDDDENALYYSEYTLNNEVIKYLKKAGAKTTKLFSERQRKKKQMERALRN